MNNDVFAQVVEVGAVHVIVVCEKLFTLVVLGDGSSYELSRQSFQFARVEGSSGQHDNIAKITH